MHFQLLPIVALAEDIEEIDPIQYDDILQYLSDIVDILNQIHGALSALADNVIASSDSLLDMLGAVLFLLIFFFLGKLLASFFIT